jgi:hypothetical protein
MAWRWRSARCRPPPWASPVPGAAVTRSSSWGYTSDSAFACGPFWDCTGCPRSACFLCWHWARRCCRAGVQSVACSWPWPFDDRSRLSFDSVSSAARLPVLMAIGSVTGWLLALCWPDRTTARAPTHHRSRRLPGRPRHPPRPRRSNLRRPGLRSRPRPQGWAIAACLLVMRPTAEMTRPRATGRFIAAPPVPCSMHPRACRRASRAAGGSYRRRPHRARRDARQPVVRHRRVQQLPRHLVAHLRHPRHRTKPFQRTRPRNPARRGCRRHVRGRPGAAASGRVHPRPDAGGVPPETLRGRGSSVLMALSVGDPRSSTARCIRSAGIYSALVTATVTTAWFGSRRVR